MADDRLTRLRAKKQQLEAQLKQLEARERDKARKRDARRKIIAGALALEHAERNQAFGAELHRLLARFVDRPSDRALFGLPPKEEGPESTARARDHDDPSAESRRAPPAPGDIPGR